MRLNGVLNRFTGALGSGNAAGSVTDTVYHYMPTVNHYYYKMIKRLDWLDRDRVVSYCLYSDTDTVLSAAAVLAAVTLAPERPGAPGPSVSG